MGRNTRAFLYFNQHYGVGMFGAIRDKRKRQFVANLLRSLLIKKKIAENLSKMAFVLLLS